MNIRDVYKRPPVSDRNWTIPFGKFKGKSIAWLMDAEPDYLAWCIENEVLSLSSALQEEFEQMNPWLLPLITYEGEVDISHSPGNPNNFGHN